jgi:hypothetical protein
MAVLILNSGRCSHGRCYFCGYGRLRGAPPTAENVIECFKRFFDQLSDDEVKVFGSGSFLDEKQVPAEARAYFMRECAKKGVKRITVESRPEFVTPQVLAEFGGFDLTVAMGLESADDRLLKKLNKGYGTLEYSQAAKTIHAAGFKVRTYLLVNPPFVEDAKASVDESVEYALKHSDSVVLINMLPHANAPLARMWVDGEWSFLSRLQFDDATAGWNGDPRIEYDAETFRFIPAFPAEMRDGLDGVGEWYLTHPHFEVWQDYLLRWYVPPKEKVLLFLPCANRKPYSESKTHQGIIGVLEAAGRNKFHEVMLSNAGIIPREFEDRYPFESYDWDESLETAQIKERYLEVTAKRIGDYLSAHGKQYLLIACFLKPDSESHQALKKACETLKMPYKNLLTEETYNLIRGEPRPMQNPQALGDLAEGLRWCLRNSA